MQAANTNHIPLDPDYFERTFSPNHPVIKILSDDATQKEFEAFLSALPQRFSDVEGVNTISLALRMIFTQMKLGDFKSSTTIKDYPQLVWIQKKDLENMILNFGTLREKISTFTQRDMSAYPHLSHLWSDIDTFKTHLAQSLWALFQITFKYYGEIWVVDPTIIEQLDKTWKDVTNVVWIDRSKGGIKASWV